MFICDRNHSCCDFQYWDRWEDVEEEAKECGHLIEAVPVVHGRWKYYHKQNIAVCTNCSFERDLDANFGNAVSCPNCGCKMDKEKE